LGQNRLGPSVSLLDHAVFVRLADLNQARPQAIMFE
jgi:hypothetical protein